MKKLVLILVMMATMNFGYALNNPDTEIGPGCLQYAIDSTAAEEEAYGSMSESERRLAIFSYEWDCEEAGGADHIMTPVFM